MLQMLGRGAVKQLLLAGATVAIVACAAGGAQKAMAPASAGPPQTMPSTDSHPDDPSHQQIEQLAAQIDQDRVKIGLPANAHAMSAPISPVAPENARVCEAPAGSKCGQSCTLSTTICANADQICKLADQLAGDEWAKQKCGDARQTCGDAKKQCCDCTP